MCINLLILFKYLPEIIQIRRELKQLTGKGIHQKIMNEYGMATRLHKDERMQLFFSELK